MHFAICSMLFAIYKYMFFAFIPNYIAYIILNAICIQYNN